MRRPRLFGLLCLVAAVTLLPVGALAQDAELEQGLDDLADEREDTERRVEELKDQERDTRDRLAALDRRLEEAEEALAVLERDLAAAEEALATARDAEDRARAQLLAVEAELVETEAELEAKRAQLEARVVAAYKYGQVKLTEIFTGVRDVSDLISSSTLVGHVLEGDRLLVSEVRELFEQVEEQRAEAVVLRSEAADERAAADAAAAEIAEATEAQAAMLADIESQRAEREEVLEELREDRAAAEGHLEGLEEESARISDQLAAIAREQEAARQAAEAERAAQEAARRAAGQRSDDTGGGGSSAPPTASNLMRPAPGGLTSPFGPRWGRMHNGVDLAGSVGSQVVAAGSGVVVHVTTGCHPTSSWSCGGGFGNYVTIVHDGGLATIYAHLASVDVAVGQQVGQGQRLGGIGNSGNSYGPHLHFETRVAGVPRNPCGYIPC